MGAYESVDATPTVVDAAKARQIELVLESVESLPTLPPVAARLLTHGSADDIDLKGVVRIIESDPALATRILGMCRKADRGLGKRITTVRHAVVMLGVDAVRSAALSVSIYDLLGKQHPARREDGLQEETPAFDRAGLWRHTIAVACAAEQIAQANPNIRVAPDEAFLAGLLHNVGKLVLELVLPKAYDRTVRLAERRASDSAPIERTLIGVDHHTAGLRICTHWGLPEALARVAWLYGRPPKTLAHEPEAPLIGVVTLAKTICREMHMGWSGEFGPTASSARLCADMGLPASTITNLMVPLHAAVAERLAVLGLDEATTPKLMLESLTNANRQLGRLNSAMSERAAQAVSQAAVLESIAAFHVELRGARSLSEVASCVIASARRAMGDGFFAMLMQEPGDRQWQLLRFDERGRFASSTLLDPPAGAKGMAISGFTDGTQLSVAMLGLLPWLGDELSDAADPRTLKLTPLIGAEGHGDEGGGQRGGQGVGSYGGGLNGAFGGAMQRGERGIREGSGGGAGSGGAGGAGGVMLVNDRDWSQTTIGGVSARLGAQTLLSTWSAALASALDRERLRRQSEELANAARAIAEAQQRASHAEAMARLGEVAAGAAHEMNNPLAIISGRAQLLLTRLDQPKDRAAAHGIADAAMSLSELISSLHLMAEPVPVKPETAPLAGLLRKSVDRARDRVNTRRDAEIVVMNAPDMIRTDPELFIAAVSEMVANAFEACPTGVVQVTVSREQSGRESEQRGTRVGRLMVSVRDTGCGMSGKALHHAFDPFFSEKPAGRQRGLGLTRAQRIAEALDGEIVLDSIQGKGTTATMMVRPMAM